MLVAIWGNTALLFGGFAMPILLCLHMAWSMRMEQLNGNIARLRAAGLLGRSLIAGKLAGALRASLILSAELWLLYTLAGLSHGFRPDAEYARTLGYLLLGLLGGWSTGCVLLLVACLIRSFAVLMGSYFRFIGNIFLKQLKVWHTRPIIFLSYRTMTIKTSDIKSLFQ